MNLKIVVHKVHLVRDTNLPAPGKDSRAHVLSNGDNFTAWSGVRVGLCQSLFREFITVVAGIQCIDELFYRITIVIFESSNIVYQSVLQFSILLFLKLVNFWTTFYFKFLINNEKHNMTIIYILLRQHRTI